MPLGASLLGIAGATGAGGNLGNLFVTLTANSIGLVNGMKQAEGAVLTSSKRIVAAASGMAGAVTAVMAAIGAAGVVQFGQFEKAMTKSTAIMGDLSADLRREMEQTARTIATNSVTSAEKLAEAYFFLASAGLNAEQSIAALSTVNTFAIAGQFDMAQATDLLTDAQSALGLTVKDTTQNMINMNRVSDVLVKANNLANATVEQFSFSLTREAGAALKSFNIDVEEGVAVLAAFADQGVKGEIAGTGLSRILRLMTSAAVNNAEAYRELNVRVFDAQGNINNLADIIGDLEKAFTGMSDEQRITALEMLGFQARVQGVILPLLGTSQRIRDYEAALRSAGGTTQDVADKQMKSFFDQLTITWNRIKDILLTIGEELTPVLRVLNTELQNLVGTSGSLNSTQAAWVNNIAPGFVAAVSTVGDVISYWSFAIKGAEVAFAGLAKVAHNVFASVVQTVSKSIEAVLDTFNKLQEAAKGVPGLSKVMGSGISTGGITAYLREIQVASAVTGAALDKNLSDKIEELAVMSAQGMFSDRFIAEFEKISSGVEKETKKVDDAVTKTTDTIINQVKRISASEATGTINRMFAQAFGDEARVDQPGGLMLRGGMMGEDYLTVQIEQFRQQQNLAEENLQILKDIGESEVNLTAETQKQKLALVEAYTEQLRQLQMAQAHIILNSAENMFGDLATITKGFAGEQSGAYKAMFAISKAFAIADATVKIAQGIAAAASLQFPLNIPAIASVVAATASIISSIQSVQLEFGGGRAIGGPVSPGKSFLVGEQGPELFSPGSAGNITPNDMLGGSNVKVIINNYTDAQAEVRESGDGRDKTIEIIIAKAKNAIASDIREGRGEVNKSMQSSFGLRRSGR